MFMHALVFCIGILMWEVFTGGEMPYGNKKNPQVVEDVTRGYRLQKPSHCHECIYIIMALCWDNVSNQIFHALTAGNCFHFKTPHITVLIPLFREIEMFQFSNIKN